ncbi:MAG: FkbM family methyltransferase [Clostridia bacterium]|nr:FkbM family methyltransferase [Clostridia bacterium]
MTDLWQNLKERTEPVYLYGMGDGADKILDECIRQGIKVSGVFASDGFVRNQVFRGFTVESYSSAKEKSPDMIALLCFGTSLENVIESVRQKAEEITLFAPSVPVYGENVFNEDFYEKNIEKINAARSLFGDEKSREVFDSVINYRLSGDINYLFSCQTDRKSNYELLNPENEIFVDLGAYRGDTVSELEKICRLKKVFAVEPDKRSFEKLKKNTEHINNVLYFNCAVGEEEKTVFVSDKKGRGTSVSQSGKEIKQKTVDEILDGERATFLKFDVEGNEKNAILGAEKTIKQYRPKMKIAAYHRSEDIFSLPLLINEICGNYRLYLRHEPSLPDWDTDIFAINEE